MIPEFGLVCLIIALLMSMVAGLMSPIGLLTGRFSYWQHLAKPAVFIQSLFISLSFVTLMSAFAQDDFSLSYVVQNSNSQLPQVYKLCALWGAHEGSLLLWVLILSFWTLAVTLYTRRLPPKVGLCVAAVLCALSFGFLLLLLQTSNPFLRLLPFEPSDGADLNPLLQDPGFVLHPPFLYMGYVGLAVPFAFAIAALLFKEKAEMWATWARPWALLAWAFLTIGITLGSWWAYYELGWGGWWFWDPVENASFMPWLSATALVHALYVADKRKLFQSWSLLLAISAFILSLIGTFLVRSGVVSSVHSFASDPQRGLFILGFIAVVIVASFTLYFLRGFRKDKQQASALSKESILLLGNIILFVAMLTVLLGTLYPIIAEVIMGERLSVGPPYFNAIFNPMCLPLLVLMAFGPHVKWQQDMMTKAKKGALLALVGAIAILYFIPCPFSLMAKIAIVLAMGLILSTLYIFYSARAKLAPKWGMMAAHLGIGLSVLGMALTTSLEVEKDLTLKVGDSTHIQGYQFEFKALEDIEGSNYEGIKATFHINKNNQMLYQVYPEKRFFIARNMPMTETAIVPGLFKDFYIALGERLDNGSWTCRIYIKPFVRFIWLGGLLVALGAFISSIRAFKESKRGLA